MFRDLAQQLLQPLRLPQQRLDQISHSQLSNVRVTTLNGTALTVQHASPYKLVENISSIASKFKLSPLSFKYAFSRFYGSLAPVVR
jgi:hypothetical protein